MTDADDKWFTVKEAARILKVHTQHVYELVRRGELESRRFGRVIRVSRKAVESADRDDDRPTRRDRQKPDDRPP